MKKKGNQDRFWPWTLGAGLVLVGIGTGLFLIQRPPSDTVDNAPRAALPTANPVPAQGAAPSASSSEPRRALPLPKLDESDTDIVGGLTELLGGEAVKEFLIPERIIRNVVVTIDNAPREKMALAQRPVEATPGTLIVSGPENARVIDSANYDRYAPFVAIVKRVDAKTLVSLYRGFQPLFQQAYEELGHPNGVFNTRLIEVVDHLLATPDVTGEIKLVQPGVLYRYADKNLEALSAGQKLLIRMGPENAAAVKAKLREILAELR